MRIIFIGQAAFGKDALDKLVEQGENVVGVITVEDSAKQKFPNPVKESALAHNIEIYQSNYLKKSEAIDWARRLQPDLLVLGFVTAFVPKEMIDLARFGGINYHPSLLPRYRGGSAINWAIIRGETQTGVTIHFIDEGVDTGPILLQETVAIEPNDTVKSLYFGKLYPMGVRMLAKAVKLIREGSASPVEQDERYGSFQPVITGADTVIDWSQPTTAVYNLIRGANPSPGALTSIDGKTVKLFDAAPGIESGAPGTLTSIGETSFSVATADGSVAILSAQAPGQKKVTAVELVSSLSLKTGDRFGF